MKRSGVLSVLDEQLAEAQASVDEIKMAISAIKKIRRSPVHSGGESVVSRAIALLKRTKKPMQTAEIVKSLGLEGERGYNAVFTGLRKRQEIKKAGKGAWQYKT